MDFTLKIYKHLLQALKSHNYTFLPFSNYIQLNNLSTSPPLSSVALAKEDRLLIILRHDVDKLPQNALRFAQIEHELGIKGTYYFRIVPESFEPKIIEKITSLGHEIGYHYEDVDLAYKKLRAKSKAHSEAPITQHPASRTQNQNLYDLAIESFLENLKVLRKIVPVKTICMHGSPLSKFDNKLLWKYYDYRYYGIIGEPYFDVDYSKVLYITDTGRKWNNQSVSVRDKVDQKMGVGKEEKQYKNLQEQYIFSNTYDIIKAVENKTLPNTIMINAHPHRWFDNYWGWTKELIMQNLKNIIKRLIVKYRN